MERFRWERKDLKSHPVPLCHRQGHLPLDQDAPSPVKPKNPPPVTAVSSTRAQSDELDVLKNLLPNVKIRKKKKSKKRNTFLSLIWSSAMNPHVWFTTQSLSRTDENWTWGQNNFSLCGLLTFQLLFYKPMECKVFPGMRTKCFPSVQWWQQGECCPGEVCLQVRCPPIMWQLQKRPKSWTQTHI